MVPAIWRLCLWLLDHVHSAQPEGGESLGLSWSDQQGLLALVLAIYGNVPSMQETVLSSLIGAAMARGPVGTRRTFSAIEAIARPLSLQLLSRTCRLCQR